MLDFATLASAKASDGNAFVGFVVLVGLVWFFGWLFSSKDKGYDIDVKRHTTGTIKKRR